ncbi:PetM family of cytochrome b6f complex subunit 7 [Methylobacterium sp. Leaf118]|uniref:PetM family of cytochrome b6f complex subunit 7 n=1 Tax=Methylobacterium sp. Leaf118 TaxID=2876562 RepID=UPI001E2BCCF1|nr:PetM family of cytochrome b6f complex subunit 7 [Methylobacterium sp. Leaf118]
MLRTVARFLGLPFISRAIGLVVMAAGFVQLCYDGARSIANNGLRITSLADLIQALPQERTAALRSAIEGVAPWADNVLLAPLGLVPASLFGLALGAALIWLGQPPREPIGFLTGP